MQPRKHGEAVYPTTIQGGHKVLDLRTKRVITRQKVTPIPISDAIIDKVESLAAAQGIKSLKFFNRKKQELFEDADINLLAGVVDYESNDDNDDNDEDQDEDEAFEDLIDDNERQHDAYDNNNNNHNENDNDTDEDEGAISNQTNVGVIEEIEDTKDKEEENDDHQRKSSLQREGYKGLVNKGRGIQSDSGH